MSIFQTDAGILKTAKVVLNSTAAVTIVTAPSNGCTVEYVRLCEVTGATPTVILDIYNGSTAYKIRGTLAMTAHTPWTDANPIQLENGETLRATASAADQVHATVTYTVPNN